MEVRTTAKKNNFKIEVNFVLMNPNEQMVPSVTIWEGEDKKYIISFIDIESNKLEFQSFMKVKQSTTVPRPWYVKWKIVVQDEEGKEYFNYTLDLKDKPVAIILDTFDLEEAKSWMPYVLDFEKKHGCKVICISEFKEQLSEFEVQLATMQDSFDGLFASYFIGKAMYTETDDNLAKMILGVDLSQPESEE